MMARKEPRFEVIMARREYPTAVLWMAGRRLHLRKLTFLTALTLVLTSCGPLARGGGRVIELIDEHGPAVFGLE